VEKLHTVLAHDMVKAVAFLTQAIQTLDAYAKIAPRAAAGPGGGDGSAPPEGQP